MCWNSEWRLFYYDVYTANNNVQKLEHKNIHKFSWTPLSQNLKSDIYYLIIKRRERLEILYTRIVKGAECESELHVVISKTYLRLRNVARKEELKSQSKNVIQSISCNTKEFEDALDKIYWSLKHWPLN